ncbi:hypothetical protein AGMMS49949_02740 [Alphaproteobacteria bacterium]|nr:hypothetical protein AGMMS49949_02740 [Alphaproteobacteria bacterium]
MEASLRRHGVHSTQHKKYRTRAALVVPEDWEIKEGLIGMKRDAVNRLVSCLWKEEEERAVFGLCTETMGYSKHEGFMYYRLRKIVPV